MKRLARTRTAPDVDRQTAGLQIRIALRTRVTAPDIPVAPTAA